MKFHTAALFETEYDPHCHFGIISAPLAAAFAGGLAEVGVGEATAGILGGVGADALLGGAANAGISALTGGDPIKGLETGLVTGGAIGLGPAVGAATGVGTTVADVGLGAAGGAIGSAITGSPLLSGVLGGGAAGLGAGVLGSGSTTAPSSTTSIAPASASGTGAGGSASATAGPGAPTPVGGSPPVDLTAGGTFFGDAAGAQAAGFQFPNATSTFGLTPIGGAATAGTSGGGGGDIGSKIMGLVDKNPGVLLAGGLLGANMLLGDKPLPAEAQIQQQAGEAATHAATLEAYQQSGTLPTGLQAVVDQQFDAAKAAVVDQYAKEGLGNSTMMVDKLNQLKAQKSAEVAQFADQLAKQGIAWAQLSGQEFSTLLNAQAQQDAAFQTALGSFAGGLAGLRSGTAKA